MSRPTFKTLNKFLLDERGWDKKPRAGGKALYGIAVRKADIQENMPIRYTTVVIDKNGGMHVQIPPDFRNQKTAKTLAARGVQPTKNIQTFEIDDDEPLREDLVYIDNSYASTKDPTRLSSLTTDTTGVAIILADSFKAEQLTPGPPPPADHAAKPTVTHEMPAPPPENPMLLPFPIAWTKRKFSMADDPLKSFLLFIDYFDAIVRTSVICFAPIIEGPRCSAWFGHFNLTGHPALGHWVAALKDLCKKSKNQTGVLNLFQFDLLENICTYADENKTVQLRNEKRSHSYVDCNDDTYEEINLQCRPVINQLNAIIYPLFSDIHVYYIDSHDLLDDSVRMRVYALQGDHPDFLHEQKNAAEHSFERIPKKNRVYLHNRQNGAWYLLDPYMKYQTCPVCKTKQVFLIDGERYLDPYAGHRVKIPELKTKR